MSVHCLCLITGMQAPCTIEFNQFYLLLKSPDSRNSAWDLVNGLKEWEGELMNKWNQAGETGAAKLGGGVPELCPGTWTWPKGHGNRWVTCRHVTELAGRVLLAEAFEHLGFFLTPSVTHIDKRPHPYHSWEAPASPRRWSSLSACKQLFNYMTNFSFLKNHYWLNFKGLETFILLSYSRTSYSQIFKQKLKWHSELQYEASPQSLFL